MDGRRPDPRAVRSCLHGAMLALALAWPAAALAGPSGATSAAVRADAAVRPAPPAPAAAADLADARANTDGAAAMPGLPAPGGPHAIGTLLMDWTDAEREEIWTDDPDDRRRLVVQFWYPAIERPVRVPAPYVLRYPQMREILDRFWLRPFPTMPTHAALEPPVLEASGPLPVVLLSHGMNSSRTLYSALAEELASHGYVVAVIDHPHWGPGVAFENGSTVGYDESMPGMMALGADRMDERVQEGIATMADDQAFVARMLPAMAGDRRVNVRRLARQMDLARVAVAGHAMGGMAAVRAAITYAFFRGAVTFDGYAWNAPGISPLGSPATPSPKPLLVLLSEAGMRGDSLAFARRHLDAFRDPRIVRLEGTRPASVTDAGFLRPGGGAPEDVAAHRRVCDTVRAFLDEHLRGRGFFDDALTRLAGAERLDLARMLGEATRTAAQPATGGPEVRP
jgi:dienelactone hydrolase